MMLFRYGRRLRILKTEFPEKGDKRLGFGVHPYHSAHCVVLISKLSKPLSLFANGTLDIHLRLSIRRSDMVSQCLWRLKRQHN